MREPSYRERAEKELLSGKELEKENKEKEEKEEDVSDCEARSDELRRCVLTC